MQLSLRTAVFAAACLAAAPSSFADEGAEGPPDVYPKMEGAEAIFDRPVDTTPPPRHLKLLFDAALLMSTKTPVAGAGTKFEVAPALRFGMLFPAPDAVAEMVPLGLPVSFGFDVAVGGMAGGNGTQTINDASFLALSEARGLLALDFDWPLLNVAPYAFVGGSSGAGLKTVNGLGTSRTYPNLMWALRSGLGVMARLGFVSLRFDSAVGVRDGRAEVSGTASAGLVF